MREDKDEEKKTNKIKGFTDLVAWRKAHELVLNIYKTTKTFPDDEKFGLILQMKRAAVSVAANIAEGFKRKGSKGKRQFYNISQASLEEVKYYLILSRDLEYCNNTKDLLELCDRVGRLLTSLVKSAKDYESK